jgi:hypothetical protein
MDARLTDTSTLWQLWYIDIFDRDSQPSLQASGENILRGLYELWRYTLKEGVQDNGSASFSRFHLTWGKTASTRGDVAIQPFSNPALLKLRQWTHLLEHEQEESTGSAQPRSERRIFVLSRLAQLHFELLQKSSRWTAASIDWSAEARELLARVERMTRPEEL